MAGWFASRNQHQSVGKILLLLWRILAPKMSEKTGLGEEREKECSPKPLLDIRDGMAVAPSQLNLGATRCEMMSSASCA